MEPLSSLDPTILSPSDAAQVAFRYRWRENSLCQELSILTHTNNSDACPLLNNLASHLRTPSMGPQPSKSVFIDLRISSWSTLEQSESLDCAQVDLNLRVERSELELSDHCLAHCFLCWCCLINSQDCAGVVSRDKLWLKPDVLVLVDTVVLESHIVYCFNPCLCSLDARTSCSPIYRHPTGNPCDATRNASQLTTYSRPTPLYCLDVRRKAVIYGPHDPECFASAFYGKSSLHDRLSIFIPTYHSWGLLDSLTFHL